MWATGTPVVLVLQSGRPVSATWENEHLPAILEAWFPGEQGGLAVAETLFGHNAPSGRLPITFPRSVGQVPCHYTRRPGGGKKYVEMNWDPLWPFGYGLAYTTFRYGAVRLSAADIAPGDSVTMTAAVTNTGKTAGVAVPQVYVRDEFSSTLKPRRQLAAFTPRGAGPGRDEGVHAHGWAAGAAHTGRGLCLARGAGRVHGRAGRRRRAHPFRRAADRARSVKKGDDPLCCIWV